MASKNGTVGAEAAGSSSAVIVLTKKASKSSIHKEIPSPKLIKAMHIQMPLGK